MDLIHSTNEQNEEVLISSIITQLSQIHDVDEATKLQIVNIIVNVDYLHQILQNDSATVMVKIKAAEKLVKFLTILGEMNPSSINDDNDDSSK